MPLLSSYRLKLSEISLSRIQAKGDAEESYRPRWVELLILIQQVHSGYCSKWKEALITLQLRWHAKGGKASTQAHILRDFIELIITLKYSLNLIR